jgi:hypothetical protein
MSAIPIAPAPASAHALSFRPVRTFPESERMLTPIFARDEQTGGAIPNANRRLIFL